MKIKWLGHATFAITSDEGVKIITDPIDNGDFFTYDKLDESADIVTISHNHFDHCNVEAVKGDPEVVRYSAEVKGIRFKAIPSFHDMSQGEEHGRNTMFTITLDGLTVFHPGDLGHPLSDSQVQEVGKVDIILLPVGGHFTIDAKQADHLCEQLNPRVIIPMHFKTEKCNLPIAGVEEYLIGKENVEHPDTSEMVFSLNGLPSTPQVVLLQDAL